MRPFAQSLRAFWADPAQRRVLMWALGALALVILAYGGFRVIRAQLDYTARQDDVHAAEQRVAVLEASLGLNEASSAETAPEIGQYDAMLLMALKREHRDATNARIEASNQRLEGIRFIGMGLIVSALAYLVAPSGATHSTPDDTPPSPQR